MLNKKVIINKVDTNFEIKKASVFYWVLESQNDIGNGKVELSFSREIDGELPYKLDEVEKKTKLRNLPLFLVAIPSALAFILVTIFLVYFLQNKDSIDKVVAFASFFIPAGILLLISVGLTYLRTKQLENIVVRQEEVIRKAKEEVAKLK